MEPGESKDVENEDACSVAEDWRVAMEEERAVGDFLWVRADPRIEDRDCEEQEGDLAWESEESGFREQRSVVREVPTREEDDGGGNHESDQDSGESGSEVAEIPEFAVVEGGVGAEVQEHGEKGEEQQGENEES